MDFISGLVPVERTFPFSDAPPSSAISHLCLGEDLCGPLILKPKYMLAHQDGILPHLATNFPFEAI